MARRRELVTPITFKVTTCSQYVSRQHPSLWHLEDIAWVLRTDARRNQIGFVQGRKLKLAERLSFDDE